jgi:radical SAM superfamily enzyme with C-terminal helix-hairpin-helix motif
VKVVEYGYRSVTAVPYPLNLNTASRETLEAIPGVGKKRATRILAKRPFHTKEELLRALDDPKITQSIGDYVELK